LGQRKDIKMGTIAEALGVSVVTVSNALNGRKGVSESMRSRIIDKARELGYNAGTHETGTRKKSYIIGCMVASRYVQEFPSFYMEIYKNIAREAGQSDCITVLEVVSDEMESEKVSMHAFQGTQTDGLLMIGEMHRDYVNHLREQNPDIPFVCVDDYDTRDDMDYILTDSFGGMERVTYFVLEQGVSDLYFVGTVGATDSINDRYLGYCKALERRGLDACESRIIPDRENGLLITPKLPEKLPQAFICNCDRTAFAVIRELRARGVRVPEDVSVAGFDNFPRETPEHIRLTTFRNDEKVIAQISLHTLLQRIEKKDCRPGGVRIVEGSLVRGESVKIHRRVNAE